MSLRAKQTGNLQDVIAWYRFNNQALYFTCLEITLMIAHLTIWNSKLKTKYCWKFQHIRKISHILHVPMWLLWMSDIPSSSPPSSSLRFLSLGLSQPNKNSFHSAVLPLILSHILTYPDQAVHIPVSPSSSFFLHSSSNSINLVTSSFVKELQSGAAVQTSSPDVHFTWQDTDSGASGGDQEGRAGWYQLIKEIPRILFFVGLFSRDCLRQSHATRKENEASDPWKTTRKWSLWGFRKKEGGRVRKDKGEERDSKRWVGARQKERELKEGMREKGMELAGHNSNNVRSCPLGWRFAERNEKMKQAVSLVCALLHWWQKVVCWSVLHSA